VAVDRAGRVRARRDREPGCDRQAGARGTAGVDPGAPVLAADAGTGANQTTLSFSKGSSRLDLAVRIAADGIAYRYVVRQNGTVAVTGEASELAVPASAAAVLLPYADGRNDYESVHVHTTVGKAAATEYGYPSLFHVGDTWLLVTESDLNGTYGGTRLTLNASSGSRCPTRRRPIRARSPRRGAPSSSATSPL